MTSHYFSTIHIACPFCGDDMEVAHKASMFTSRTTSSASAGQKQSRFVEHEKYVAKDCPNCGANGDKIEKALLDASSMYEPKAKSKEELKKQLEELGLGGRIGGKK